VPLEDLYRYSLSNDNIEPTCGEICGHWLRPPGRRLVSEKPQRRDPFGNAFLSLRVNSDSGAFAKKEKVVFDGWLCVEAKVVAN